MKEFVKLFFLFLKRLKTGLEPIKTGFYSIKNRFEPIKICISAIKNQLFNLEKPISNESQ